MNQVISSNNGRLCGIEEGANHANELRLPCSVPDPSCQPHGCPFPCLATEGETSSSTLSPCCCGPEGLEGNEHEHEHEHEPTERAEEEEVIFVSEDDEDGRARPRGEKNAQHLTRSVQKVELASCPTPF